MKERRTIVLDDKDMFAMVKDYLFKHMQIEPTKVCNITVHDLKATVIEIQEEVIETK